MPMVAGMIIPPITIEPVVTIVPIVLPTIAPVVVNAGPIVLPEVVPLVPIVDAVGAIIAESSVGSVRPIAVAGAIAPSPGRFPGPVPSPGREGKVLGRLPPPAKSPVPGRAGKVLGRLPAPPSPPAGRSRKNSAAAPPANAPPANAAPVPIDGRVLGLAPPGRSKKSLS